MISFKYPAGATPLDPNEINGLKLKHITTQEELDRWEQYNISEAISWVSRARKDNILTEAFVKKLHEKMFGKIWEWAGEFRQIQKNIGVNWQTIPVELKKLLEDVTYWVEHDTYPSDEIAYRFHHRLVKIHCFPNGNGRHARLITEILLSEFLKKDPFSWGRENLVQDGVIRENYIAALKAADENNFELLAAFVRS